MRPEASAAHCSDGSFGRPVRSGQSGHGEGHTQHAGLRTRGNTAVSPECARSLDRDFVTARRPGHDDCRLNDDCVSVCADAPTGAAALAQEVGVVGMDEASTKDHARSGRSRGEPVLDARPLGAARRTAPLRAGVCHDDGPSAGMSALSGGRRSCAARSRLTGDEGCAPLAAAPVGATGVLFPPTDYPAGVRHVRNRRRAPSR